MLHKNRLWSQDKFDPEELKVLVEEANNRSPKYFEYASGYVGLVSFILWNLSCPFWCNCKCLFLLYNAIPHGVQIHVYVEWGYGRYCMVSEAFVPVRKCLCKTVELMH